MSDKTSISKPAKPTKPARVADSNKPKKISRVKRARTAGKRQPAVKAPKSDFIPSQETPRQAIQRPLDFFSAVGRRKAAVARLRLLTRGSGYVKINDRDLDKYFTNPVYQQVVLSPIQQLGLKVNFDIVAKVGGGGSQGQAEAVRHALARALLKYNEDWRKQLRLAGFLTRDARVKERKKYGLKKARRAPQWQKR